ncbi:uncharacterized protein LOC125188089 [Salvia hispanica]|uniref:uncharacterized protein LOC125188089 n=1 Tax=Salvia hispanica TaxID=49212 RepID=UPI0020097123|nr:uncharacterized protein LOC125188089 [Salvia hispanica]
MTDASEEFKFTLKVMINKKKNKVLFAESDCQFVDILLSFLSIFQIISILGITNMDEAESIDVNIGFNEIMSLLKGSFISPTPLSYFLLNTTSLPLDLEPKTLVNHSEIKDKLGSKKMVLKVFIQKSKSKVLYAVADVEFLFSLFIIPLGGVGHLLAGKSCIKAIDNLQRSVADLADKYFKIPSMKNRLMKPSLIHGSVSENYILPLDQQCMTRDELENFKFSSLKFPKGQGRYLAGPIAYMVTDDLIVNPLCIQSTISTLREKNIPISDVKEIEVQVGLKEALSILKASLTSTSALTDALLNSVPNKQPKTEA